MRLLKQAATPLAASLAIILVVTAVLFYFKNAQQQHHLIFFYLFPTALVVNGLRDFRNPSRSLFTLRSDLQLVRI